MVHSSTGARFIDLGIARSPEGTTHALRAYVPQVGGPGPRPLLVMFDGQNIFEDHGSYSGGWHAHEAVEKLSASTTRAPVVLGIANGGTHRIRELGAHTHIFLDSVVAEAVGRAEATLRLTPRRVIAGASRGGLAALTAWLSRRERFDGAIALSPSLWFGHHHLLMGLLSGLTPLPPTGRLYLDAGERERGRMYADAAQLAAHLARRGLGPDRLMWRPDARGAHHERHWRRRLPKALRFMFRTKGG